MKKKAYLFDFWLYFWIYTNVSKYMQLAIEHLQKQGMKITPDQIARLSPLIHEHINMLGQYNFDLDSSILQGLLRPLRDPDPIDEWLGLA